MPLLTRRPWTSQPRGVDRVAPDNPLTAGLTLLWSASSPLVDIYGRAIGTASGTWAPSYTGAGMGYRGAAGGTPHLEFAPPVGATSTNYTVFAYVNDDTGSGVTRNPIDGDNQLAARVFQLRFQANDGVEFITFDTAGNPYFATSSALTFAPRVGLLVGRIVNNSLSVWWQGKRLATGSASNTAKTVSAAALLNIAVNKANSGALFQGFPGQVLYAGHVNRGWSDGEIMSLSANPWQLLESPRRRLWVASAGGVFAGIGAESATATDASTAAPTMAAARTEAATAADAATAALNPTVSGTEAATATESSSGAANPAAQASESATATDSSTATLPAVAAITEAASATESASATASGNYTATVAESASATDAATAALAAVATVTEAATAAESSSAAAAGNYTASVTEAASATEAGTATGAFLAAAAEPAAPTDACTAALAAVAAVTEAPAATEASTGLPSGAYAAAVTEAGTAADASTRVATMAAAALEAGSAQDASAGLRITFAQALETATPIDVSGSVWAAGSPPVTPARRQVVANANTAARPSNLSTARRSSNRARS